MNQALQQQLTDFREQIDEIDQQMIQLLNQRANIALAVGEAKKQFQMPIFQPKREQEVITKLAEMNLGPLQFEHIQSIWREIMSASQALERTLQVAYLGPTGTYSEQAVFEYFGQAVETMPCQSIDDVFRAVEAGSVEWGVVPIENSTEGSVSRTQDLFLRSALFIQAEIILPIRHNLLAKNNDLSQIEQVCAHEQSLAQCHGWLSRHLPHVVFQAVSSNAKAASLAAHDSRLAAIAGERAAQHYGLQLLYRQIQDDPHNRTRFYVISKTAAQISGNDQTSLIVSVKNEPGAMYHLLAPLAKHQVSMTRFESRPARMGTWEYYFYIDLLGHQSTPHVANALQELKKQVVFLKLLGSYPKI